MRRAQRVRPRKPAAAPTASQPEPAAVPVEPTHVRLRAWFQKMGFHPGESGPLHSAEDFKTLCKPETVAFWESLMRNTTHKDVAGNLRQYNAERAAESRNRLENASVELAERIEELKKEHGYLSDTIVEKNRRNRSQARRFANDRSAARLLGLKTEQLNEVAAHNDDVVDGTESAISKQSNDVGGGDCASASQDADCRIILQECGRRLKRFEFGDVSAVEDLSQVVGETCANVPAAVIRRQLATMRQECEQECRQLDDIGWKQANEDIEVSRRASGIKTFEESAVVLAKKIVQIRSTTGEVRVQDTELKKENDGLTAEHLVSLNAQSSDLVLIKVEDESDLVNDWLRTNLNLESTKGKLKLAKTHVAKPSHEKEDVARRIVVAKIDQQALSDASKALTEQLENRVSVLPQLTDTLTSLRSETANKLAASSFSVANVATLEDRMEPNCESVRKLVDIAWGSVDSVTLPDGSDVLRSELLIARGDVFEPHDAASTHAAQSLAGLQRAEDVAISYHRAKQQADRLRWAEHNLTPHFDSEPDFDLATMKASIETGEEKLDQSLDDLSVKETELRRLVQDLPILADLAADFPVGDLIPDARKVGERTYKECLALFDSMPDRSEAFVVKQDAKIKKEEM